MDQFKFFVTYLFLVVFSLTSTAGIFAGDAREDCRVCGMWIDQYMHTRHVLTETDGSRVSFCSYTCAAKHIKKHGKEAKQLQAADYLTAELIDAEEAVYLVGSDAPQVMSYTSIIAFAEVSVANDFQKTHGGRVMTYSEVFDQY